MMKSFTEQTEKCYLVNNNYLAHNIMIMFCKAFGADIDYVKKGEHKCNMQS